MSRVRAAPPSASFIRQTSGANRSSAYLWSGFLHHGQHPAFRLTSQYGHPYPGPACGNFAMWDFRNGRVYGRVRLKSMDSIPSVVPENAPVLFLARAEVTYDAAVSRREKYMPVVGHGSKRDGWRDVLLDQRFRVRIISSGPYRVCRSGVNDGSWLK